MGVPVVSVVADKGYNSREEIEACILNGIVPYVGFKDDKEERLLSLDYEKKDITDRMRNSTDPKDISACLHAGVLPSCYENTNISVEALPSEQLGCFQRSQDQKTVICPMGFTLRKRKNKRDGAEYFSHAACRKRTNRCTPSKNPKSVYFGPETTHVAAVMYGDDPYTRRPRALPRIIHFL